MSSLQLVRPCHPSFQLDSPRPPHSLPKPNQHPSSSALSSPGSPSISSLSISFWAVCVLAQPSGQRVLSPLSHSASQLHSEGLDEPLGIQGSDERATCSRNWCDLGSCGWGRESETGFLAVGGGSSTLGDSSSQAFPRRRQLTLSSQVPGPSKQSFCHKVKVLPNFL